MIRLKEGFKGERSLQLSEDLLTKHSKNPLIGNLYIRKMGFFPKVKYHYIQKELGCNYAMLIYCTAGRGWYQMAGKRYIIEKDQSIIIPPNTPYSFGTDDNDPWTIYWIHFCGTLIHHFLPHSYEPIAIPPTSTSRIQDRIGLFEDMYNRFQMAYIESYMQYVSACLYQFLSSFTLLKEYQHSTNERQTDSFATRVIYYMRENIHHRMSLEDFAHYFNYSTSHFSTLFQKETGLSPINYFIHLKIQMACQYIELTNMSLSEIAKMIGFDEPAYFSRQFTKIMHLSPSEYRKQELKRN